jgi:hypothetical protein
MTTHGHSVLYLRNKFGKKFYCDFKKTFITMHVQHIFKKFLYAIPYLFNSVFALVQTPHPYNFFIF